MSDAAPLKLLHALARHATETPDRLAVREAGDGGPRRTLTYAQLHRRVVSLAAHLTHRIEPAATVLLCCPNTCDFHIAFLAVLQAGCDVFPFSPDAVMPEVNDAIARSGAAALIAPASVIAKVSPQIKFALPLEDLHHEWPDRTSDFPRHADLLLQTSGTTGCPGIVRRSGRAVDAVATNLIEAIGFSGDDHVLAALPLCHSYGLEHGLLAPIAAGSTIHLCPSFNLATILREMRDQPISIFPAVPTIFEMLGELADEGARFPRLRTAYSAGSILPLRVIETVRRKLAISIGQVYGTTEVGSVTYGDTHDPRFEPLSVGRPMRDVAVNVGDEGNVHISSPSMFNGYVGGDGSEIQDGFFATGDVGLFDGDLLTITGRLKLLIDIGGLKVNPIEVEQLLLEHPGVAECVVIPVRLSETVNRLKALIIPHRASQPPASQELSQFARQRLTAYKVPRVFEIRDSLPRTATGKILRHLV